MFQHTATRRWLPGNYNYIELRFKVSTHSHPKVAADRHNDSIRHKQFQHTATRRWLLYAANNITFTAEAAFQHTATRRWLHGVQYYALTMIAGFNTQPPEGGCTGIFITIHHDFAVSTHSHPKVAAERFEYWENNKWFQHTATRRWLQSKQKRKPRLSEFQHTATRRWLQNPPLGYGDKGSVSTHSHPKVAAVVFVFYVQGCRFNTQPPEGGCWWYCDWRSYSRSFNTQPPEGGCSLHKKARKISKLNTVFR